MYQTLNKRCPRNHPMSELADRRRAEVLIIQLPWPPLRYWRGFVLVARPHVCHGGQTPYPIRLHRNEDAYPKPFLCQCRKIMHTFFACIPLAEHIGNSKYSLFVDQVWGCCGGCGWVGDDGGVGVFESGV
jgi:hypothetical protein